jgi:excisionase family DNA binding protein
MSPETSLTIEQAAERLQMNKEVLRRWVRDGRVPAVKLGRHWRLTESTIDRVLNGVIDVSSAPAESVTVKRGAAPKTPVKAKRRK